MLNANWRDTQIGHSSPFSEFPTKTVNFCKWCRLMFVTLILSIVLPMPDFCLIRSQKKILQKKTIFMFTPFGNLYGYEPWCNCWFEQYSLARNDFKGRLPQNHLKFQNSPLCKTLEKMNFIGSVYSWFVRIFTLNKVIK